MDEDDQVMTGESFSTMEVPQITEMNSMIQSPPPSPSAAVRINNAVGQECKGKPVSTDTAIRNFYTNYSKAFNSQK